MATTSSTIAECRDLNWRCPFWSMSVFNYCEKYPEIAYKTCIKSCGNCHNKPIESTTSTTTTTIQPSKVTPTNSNGNISGECFKKDLYTRLLYFCDRSPL